jgi:hypothetical protein
MTRQRDAQIICRSCRGVGYTVWRIRNTQPDGTPLVTWRHEVERHGEQLPPLGPGWNPACPSCGAPMDRQAAR